MRMNNRQIAGTLVRLADLLEIKGEKAFRVLAFRKAAETVTGLVERLDVMMAGGFRPRELPGIGPAIEQLIVELVARGDCTLMEQLRAEVPDTLPELLAIRGMTPLRVRAVLDGCGVTGIDSLATALERGELGTNAGFPETVVDRIGRSLKAYMPFRGHSLRPDVEAVAEPLREYLCSRPGIARVEYGCSYRRHGESLVELCGLVEGRPTALTAALEGWPNFDRWLEQGDDWCRFLSDAGLPVHLQCCLPERWGCALHSVTGSAAYVAAIAAAAAAQGAELGLDSLLLAGQPHDCPDEETLYRLLGLTFVPPELREEEEAVRWARGEPLPRLLDAGELRGDLHLHTTFTDGRNSPEEMVRTAIERGYEYVAVTDHTSNVRIANGLEPGQVEGYLAALDELGARYPHIRILKGLEVDILPDGRLDMPDEILARLDLVAVAVHSQFDQPREVMTARVVGALANPLVHLLTHPTGRLIGRRAELQLDLDRLFDVAAREGVMLEINSNPERLDLNAANARRARDQGITVTISTDAHSTDQMANLERGVWQARRGGLGPADVLNSLPLAALLERLNARRRRLARQG